MDTFRSIFSHRESIGRSPKNTQSPFLSFHSDVPDYCFSIFYFSSFPPTTHFPQPLQGAFTLAKAKAQLLELSTKSTFTILFLFQATLLRKCFHLYGKFSFISFLLKASRVISYGTGSFCYRKSLIFAFSFLDKLCSCLLYTSPSPRD